MSQVLIEERKTGTARGTRRLLVLACVLIFLCSFTLVAVPVWLIMPFKAQTPGGIEVSYLFRRWSPVLTIVATLAICALSIYMWKAARWWTRGFLVILFLISLVPAWASRQNHFEWMFKPIADPKYSRIPQATNVADGDMVLAVEMNGDAAAYPIREMAYHHVVEDIVGGVPLAATY